MEERTELVRKEMNLVMEAGLVPRYIASTTENKKIVIPRRRTKQNLTTRRSLEVDKIDNSQGWPQKMSRYNGRNLKGTRCVNNMRWLN